MKRIPTIVYIVVTLACSGTAMAIGTYSMQNQMQSVGMMQQVRTNLAVWWDGFSVDILRGLR